MIHIYTGNGKGKTTAALGLSARAIGAGQKVAFFQFFKGGVKSSEEKFFENKKGMTFKRFRQVSPFFDKKADVAKLKIRVNKDLSEALLAASSGRYGVVVFDELTYAFNYGLCDESLFSEAASAVAGDTLLVITGRDAGRALVSAADLVTEMKEIKHPFNKKIKARRGVEL